MTPILLSSCPLDQQRIAQALHLWIASGQWAKYQGEAQELLIDGIKTLTGHSLVRLTPSGTAAVELALRGCQLSPGDEVIVSAFDYPGNFRCIEAVNAIPVVVDTEPGRWTINPRQVEEAISPRTKVILASHLYQHLADMPALRALANRLGVLLMEDACQAPGASVADRPAGSWGDIAILSFGGSKLLTSGTGGALATCDARIFQRIKIYCERPSDAFAMSPLQAAAILPQLESLPQWNEMRRTNAVRISEAIKQNSSLQFPKMLPSDRQASLYKLAWLINPDNIAATEHRTKFLRSEAIHQALEFGLPCGEGFPCFGRRSSRRCRVVTEPVHAAEISKLTMVLDHRALVQDEQVTQQIIHRLARLGSLNCKEND